MNYNHLPTITLLKMKKENQLKKNLKLTSRLLDYLAKHPEAASEIPSETSYIVFSSNDQNLNEQNEKMLKKLRSEGQKIVKATNKPGPNPWKLEFLF